MEVATDKLVEAKHSCTETELTLLIKQGADLEMVDDSHDWSRQPHFLPVLSRSNALPGGETLQTFEAWDEGR